MYRVILTNSQARIAREKLGLSQGKVAVTLGLNRAYLSLFETGKYVLPDSELTKLREYYSASGFSFDETEPSNERNFKQEELDSGREQQTIHVRVVDGFVIPANIEVEEAERILSDYAENAKTIRTLCGYDIREHHTSQPFLFWEGELDEAEVEKRIKAVLVLMAKNYALIEMLHGHEVCSSQPDQPQSNSNLRTTGDFVGAMLWG